MAVHLESQISSPISCKISVIMTDEYIPVWQIMATFNILWLDLHFSADCIMFRADESPQYFITSALSNIRDYFLEYRSKSITLRDIFFDNSEYFPFWNLAIMIRILGSAPLGDQSVFCSSTICQLMMVDFRNCSVS